MRSGAAVLVADVDEPLTKRHSVNAARARRLAYLLMQRKMCRYNDAFGKQVVEGTARDVLWFL